MGTCTMTNDPILSREFNATIQALREKQDEFQATVLKTLEDGFASVRQRFEGLERETDRLSDLSLKQAEHNGATIVTLEKHLPIVQRRVSQVLSDPDAMQFLQLAKALCDKWAQQDAATT